MSLKMVTATLAAVMLIVLTGCGDGTDGTDGTGGTNGTNGTDGTDGTGGTTSSLTITAVDGYIAGATVTDQQGNTAFSNGDGTYSFFKTPIYPISLTGGTLVDTGDAFSANIITGSGEAHMYATSGGVISPITTLLTTITNNKATATIDSTLSAKLASMMGVTEAELLTDFVASENVDLAKITQVIHLMAQEPGLYSAFKANLGAASGSLFSGVSGAATTTMNAKNVSGDLSAIKRTVYDQIISDVSAYTGTAAGLEVGIDANKSMLENIATIETLGGDVGSDITSLQTVLALAEIAGSGDSTKTITASQLTTLGVSSVITGNAVSVALMADVIRQSTTVKYDTKAEVLSLEPHITTFVSHYAQAAVIPDANLLASYKIILDNTTVETYKQVSLVALTNATSTVTATSVAAIQTLLDSTADISSPLLTVTAVTLIENAGLGQAIANATATFATGSKLGVFSLTSTGDYAALSIDPATGDVTVNASPDFETKSAYVFTVKVTAVTDDSLVLAIGDRSVQITGAISDVDDSGITSVDYSYGAEDGDAHAIGGTNGQSDDTDDNALLITFNMPVHAGTLVSENFSIDGVTLDSDLTTSYNAEDKLLTITIGNAAIDVDSTSNGGNTSTVSSSNSVKLLSGLDLDNHSTIIMVRARTGITHNLISYNTVKSPDTGVYWLDRNLGATQVATSSTDTDAYGGLYQWGRPADGHQIIDSVLIADRSSSITPGTPEFINNSISPYDWTQNSEQDSLNVDDTRVLRSAFLSQIDGSGICPLGFRLPTDAEFGLELVEAVTVDVEDGTSAYNSFLKMTLPGRRGYYNGDLYHQGTVGLYSTSSSPYGQLNGSIAIYITSSTVYPNTFKLGEGMSIRCRGVVQKSLALGG
jgi:uncharacterized lipoprotein YehR (DUF1307 family)